VVAIGALGGVQPGDHVCAFVDGADDGLDVMAQAVTAGVAAGDRVLVYSESMPPAAVLDLLEARGVALGPTQRAGQVQVLTAEDAGPPAGRFEPRRMIDSLRRHVRQAGADRYAGLRLVGDMTRVLRRPAAADGLADYEAQVNRLYLDGQALGICLYDRHAVDGDLLHRVAGAHPAMVGADAETGWVPLLRIRRTRAPYGLRLVGEADVSNRLALDAAVEAVLDEQPDPAVPIHVDVEGLRFADAAAAALLGRLATRAPAGAHLAGCQSAVEAVLDRLGVIGLPKVRATSIGSPGTERIA
jgi:hypothetical protein